MTILSITHWWNPATDNHMKRFFFISMLLALSIAVTAQNQQPRPGQQPRQGWGQWGRARQIGQQPQQPVNSGKFSPAEYAKQQREFFIQNAGLTDKEADAFFPIYNELQQKKREINREIRRNMRQEPGTERSEEQSMKAIDAKAEANIKIAELEKEYLQSFKKVLPASKILKVQNAEEQFNSQILKDIQQSRGHQFQRPGPPMPQ